MLVEWYSYYLIARYFYNHATFGELLHILKGFIQDTNMYLLETYTSAFTVYRQEGTNTCSQLPIVFLNNPTIQALKIMYHLHVRVNCLAYNILTVTVQI